MQEIVRVQEIPQIHYMGLDMINFRELFTFHSAEEDREARMLTIGLLIAAIGIQYLRGLL